MRKKISISLFVILILSALFLIGCGQNKSKVTGFYQQGNDFGKSSWVFICEDGTFSYGSNSDFLATGKWRVEDNVLTLDGVNGENAWRKIAMVDGDKLLLRLGGVNDITLYRFNK